MIYLLDTNICILLIRQKSPQVLARLTTHAITDIALSMITVAELQHGVQKSQKHAQNQHALEQFLLPFTLLPFEVEDTLLYGQLRASLERQGQPIGGFDMLIAAQALRYNLTVVTNNVHEFRRIPNLTIEDWIEP